MPGRERLFRIREADIQQILFADNSDDDDDDLLLDDEDQNFLVEDVDNVAQEVIIEHPDPALTNEPSTSTHAVCTAVVEPAAFYGRPRRQCKPTIQTPAIDSGERQQQMQSQPTISNSATSRKRLRAKESHHPDDACKETTVDEYLPAPTKLRATSHGQSKQAAFDFKWNRRTTTSKNDVVDYSYRQVHLKTDDSADIDAVDVFEQVSYFVTLVSLIVEQIELYMKQKGIPFHTNADEIRASLGICLVMGYHVLPSIRDYWSTQPDLQVPYVANTMTRARFESIRSALHFNDNDDMVPRTHPQFDRAFKVRPLIDHFNRCFQAARNPSKQQSIDEHMIKFKGQNIMKQYIRNKPVKWGFKLWCRCDAVSGYLYQFDMYTGRKTDTEHGLGEPYQKP